MTASLHDPPAPHAARAGTARFDSGCTQIYHRAAMGQRPERTGREHRFVSSWICAPLIVLAIVSLLGGEKASPPADSTATPPTIKTVASLVPAVTDLIIGMGARDRLV